ncbi:MAG: choice-of-anchor J domain-containing protein [Puniceicoccaceae bacterium]
MKYRSTKLATLLSAAVLSCTSVFALQINEIRNDEPGGTDSNEFIELKGDPQESLDGLWYIVIGDHTSFGSDDGENIPNKAGGVVEFAVKLDGYSIPDDGHFLMTTTNMAIDALGVGLTDVDFLIPEINFENSDNITHMLVRGYNSYETEGREVTNYADQYDDLAVDIDDDDDGVPNATLPWIEVIDAVGLVEVPNDQGPEEPVYGAAFGGADVGPNGSFTPGMVYRGNDDNEWNMGVFNLLNAAGDGLFPGDDFNGPAVDSPGRANPDSPEPPVIPSVSGIKPTTVATGDTVTISGSTFTNATYVQVGDNPVPFTVIDDDTIEIVASDEAGSGMITVGVPDGSSTSASTLLVLQTGWVPVLFEDFELNQGNFSIVNVTSDRDWEYDTFGANGFMEMSGFGADVASEDWLVSPGIDLSGTTEPSLAFNTARNFDGPDLEVFISTDFDGANTGTATWTAIPATLSLDDYDIVSSGIFDLDAYIGQTVYVGFKYVSSGTGPGEAPAYQVHDFVVYDIPPMSGVLLFEDFETDLGDFAVVSVTSDAVWEHGTFGGNGFADISGFGADEASDDWLISPEVDLAGAVAPILTFATARNFGGPELEVLISTDYTGDPATATWSAIVAPLSQGGYDLVPSGRIALSMYIGETVHLAFRYTSTGTGGGDGAVYQVHEVEISDTVYHMEDFEGGDLGDYSVVSIASNKDWELDDFGGDNFAEMSGFGADVASDDWLISPAIDLTDAYFPLFAFVSARNFDGPTLEVYASDDYTGDPNTATWEQFDPALSQGGYEEVYSGEQPLDNFTGGTVHIGFRYTSSGTGGGTSPVYQIDDIVVFDGVFTPGWEQDDLVGWVYDADPSWSYLPNIGFVNGDEFPWVWSASGGWFYIGTGTIPTGMWIYIDGKWAWLIESRNGEYEFLDGTTGSFMGGN